MVIMMEKFKVGLQAKAFITVIDKKTGEEKIYSIEDGVKKEISKERYEEYLNGGSLDE